MGLQIVGGTDAGIGHNGRSAARLIGGRRVDIAISTTAINAVVERVVGAKLVAHLMGYIVYIKAITHRYGLTGNALRLEACLTNHTYLRQAASAGCEHMAYVVVGIAYAQVAYLLVGIQATVSNGINSREGVITIDTTRGCGEYQGVLVSNKVHAHRQLPLIDTIDAVKRGNHLAEYLGYSGSRQAGSGLGVLMVAGKRQAIGAQLVAVGGTCRHFFPACCQLLSASSGLPRHQAAGMFFILPDLVVLVVYGVVAAVYIVCRINERAVVPVEDDGVKTK